MLWTANRALGLCIVALTSAYIIATGNLQDVALGGPVGPQAYPYLIGGLGMLTGLILLFDLRRGRSEGLAEDDFLLRSPASRSKMFAVAGVLAWAFIYATLIDKLGFMLACTIFLFGMSLYFNRRMIVVNALVSILFPAAVFFGWRALGITLPNGVLSFL